MPIEVRLVVTLAVGIACGLLFRKLKVPAGLMVGALAGTAVLNCTTGVAWVPVEVRTAVQIVAGAFIGCSIDRGDVARLRHIAGPVAVMLASCAVVMTVAGTCLCAFGGLDFVTAFMSGVPGGVNDVPVIAADMGADAPTASVLQVTRQILGLAVLPGVIALYDRLRARSGHPDVAARVKEPLEAAGHADGGAATVGGAVSEGPTRASVAARVVAVLAVCACAGIAGRATHVPGMTLVFALAAALVLKLGFDFAIVPRWMKNASRVAAGCYVGTLFTVEFVHGAGQLVVPIMIIVAVYLANCFATGFLERKLFGYGRKEGMLIANPAGASDMALIMDDMGLRNPDVTIMQTMRAIVAASVFPQIINVVAHLLHVL